MCYVSDCFDTMLLIDAFKSQLASKQYAARISTACYTYLLRWKFFVTVAMFGHEPSGKIRGGKRLIQVGFKPWMARC